MQTYNVYRELPTEWKTDYRVPCHTYIFDDKKRLCGYIKEGQPFIKWFKKPSTQWSGNKRKFEKLGTIDA